MVAAAGGCTNVETSVPESGSTIAGAVEVEADVIAAAEASIDDNIEGDDDGGGVGSEGAGSGTDDNREMSLLFCVVPSSLAVDGGTASSVVVDQLGGMEGYTNDFVCVRGGTIRPVMIGTGLSGERYRLC